MKIIIFGATGTAGSHIVAQALQKGFKVTAFTRNPDKLNHIKDSNLEIIEGDVTRPSDVEMSLKGIDLVICALGDGAKGEVRAAGTLNIIQAMKKAGINRLICQSTLGMGESWKNLNFFWKHIMFGFLLRKAFNDHQRQEKYILESGLDFTIVRPSAFTNGQSSGNYKIGFGPGEKDLSLKISLADIADFILNQAVSDSYIGQAVSISN